jgi:uncharacterized damage-inducible protein DinB
LDQNTETLLREQVAELLTGGFAPVVIMLREFHFDKTGIVLPGLHFSAFSLLGHMRKRQQSLLQFIKDPGSNPDVWQDAYWPQRFEAENREEWLQEIHSFEQELEEAIHLVQDPSTDLFKVQENGKTISWAAMALFHHNGYHIGQMKALGRQLGVW